MSTTRGIPKIQNTINNVKLEMADEIGTKKHAHIPGEKYGEVPGNIVKVMIESFEKSLIK